MMNKHFAAAFVAVSAVLATAPHGAFARTPLQGVSPVAANDSTAWVSETGKASYYGPVYNGRRAADGSRFDQMELTAAHPWLPFGTKVRVMLADSSRSVIVTITDRLNSNRRIVDLSLAAARELGMLRRGIAQVTLVPA